METSWKQGDAMQWSLLVQFQKALIKIGKNGSLMALSLAPKYLSVVEFLGSFIGCFVI